MRQRISRNSGFTLIEVLIASAIAVASMGLLLSLFGNGLDRLERIENQAQQIVVEKEILSRLSLVNPAKENSGKGVIGDWGYNWTASPLTNFQHVTDYFGAAPYPRYVALFKIDIEIQPDDSQALELQVERLGWQSNP